MAETIFPGKFFFVVIYGFSFFGEIPFYHFPFSSFSRDWFISFLWFLAQLCKMAIPKMWRGPIFEKKIWANLGQKLPKNRVFWTLCQIGSLVFSDFWLKRWSAMCCKKWIFVFWGNSLLPISCHQLFFLVDIFSSCSLHFLTLWQFFYFYLTFIVR